MTTHNGYLVFSKKALLFLSTQIDSRIRALTEASVARMLLLRLQGCNYDVFCECMDSGVSVDSFGTLI
jgi:hypothetical protein